ncbi:Sulfate permease 2 [Rhodotorula toruloides]
MRNDDAAGSSSTRDIYLPLRPDGIRNPDVVVGPPPAGMDVLRLEESFIYIISVNYTDQVVDYARRFTRNGQDYLATLEVRTFHVAIILFPRIKRALLAGCFGGDVDATGPQTEVDDVAQQQNKVDQFSKIQRPPLSRDISAP